MAQPFTGDCLVMWQGSSLTDTITDRLPIDLHPWVQFRIVSLN